MAVLVEGAEHAWREGEASGLQKATTVDARYVIFASNDRQRRKRSTKAALCIESGREGGRAHQRWLSVTISSYNTE